MSTRCSSKFFIFIWRNFPTKRMENSETRGHLWGRTDEQCLSIFTRKNGDFWPKSAPPSGLKYDLLFLLNFPFFAFLVPTLINFDFKLTKNWRCTLFEKSFCPKIQFWENLNIFTSISPKNFLTIFLVKSKLSIAKKSKTITFSRVFHPNFFDNFSREIKVVNS